MFLKRLALENLRSLESCEISFDAPAGDLRPLTLIVGENGSGKSTILRSIALLLAGYDALPTLLIEPDSWIGTGKKSCTIAAEIITPSNQLQAIEIGIKKGDDIAKVLRRNVQSLDILAGILESCPAPLLTAGYGAWRRPAPPGNETAPPNNPASRAHSLGSLFFPSHPMRALEEWAIDLDAGRTKKSSLLHQAFSELLPGVRFHGIDRRRGKILFDTPDGVLALNQLGDGLQGLMAWLGDLLFRIRQALPGLGQPFDAHGLLLIDEVEIHLHPAWQREVIGFLKNRLPNFQIVATTDSPLTAHQAGSGDLYFLQRDRPDLPPALHRYEGDPSRLMLHQLLASPVFGIHTVDSKHVEMLREQQRSLTSRPARTLTASERTRRRELEQEIRDLPGWNSMLPGEQEKRELLESIEQALGGSAPPSARRRNRE